MLICIEGPDKTGKTTQCEILSKVFNIPILKFPNEDNQVGRRIRSILNKELPYEAWSFQALMAIDKLMYPGILTPYFMDQTDHAVLDRYTPSAYAYGHAEGIPANVTHVMNERILIPDITFVFEGEPFGQDTDIYGNEEFQERVVEGYKEFCNDFEQEFNVIRVNSNRPIEEVTEDLVYNIYKEINKCQ